MKGDFQDKVNPTIPKKGHVTVRGRIRSVNHGVNIEMQLRTLGTITYSKVAKHAILGILACCVREGMDSSNVQLVLDEANEAYHNELTEIWDFGPELEK